MSLVLVGDIAYPYKNAIAIDSIPSFFKDKLVVGNLEGPFIDIKKPPTPYDAHKYNIYSSLELVEVLKKLNVKSVSLANNHFCDFKGAVKETIRILQDANIDYFGLESKKWSVIKNGEVAYALYGTCTFLTGGSNKGDRTLNFFHAKRALRDIRTFKKRHPDKAIIVYIHWGYELAQYPQPADREWAREAMEAGAKAIVGHHPHVVQGIEEYKDGLIAYSLGNFIFPQVQYLNKRLKYRSIKVLREMILEVNFEKQPAYSARFLKYSLEEQKLEFEDINQEKEISALTLFRNLSDKEYVKWFQQKRGLSLRPSYSSYHNELEVFYKRVFTKSIKTVRKALIIAGLHNPFV